MGKQIGFLQNNQDEKDFIDFLQKDSRLFALPFTTPNNTILPEPLNETKLQNLIFFQEREWLIIKANLRLNDKNEYATRQPKGCYLEWRRSILNLGNHPNRNYKFGRLYFNTRFKNDDNIANDYLLFYNRAVSYIRRNYPLKTKEKPV